MCNPPPPPPHVPFPPVPLVRVLLLSAAGESSPCPTWATTCAACSATRTPPSWARRCACCTTSPGWMLPPTRWERGAARGQGPGGVARRRSTRERRVVGVAVAGVVRRMAHCVVAVVCQGSAFDAGDLGAACFRWRGFAPQLLRRPPAGRLAPFPYGCFRVFSSCFCCVITLYVECRIRRCCPPTSAAAAEGEGRL